MGMVGLNETTVAKYVREQEKNDQIIDRGKYKGIRRRKVLLNFWDKIIAIFGVLKNIGLSMTGDIL